MNPEESADRSAAASSSSTQPQPSLSRRRWKLAAFVLLVAVISGLAIVYRDQLTLQRLIEHERQLYQWKDDYPLATYAAAFAIYVLVTGASLPGATVMTLLYGKFFGLWPGLILVSFASTTGATVAFLVSRYFLRDAVQTRFGKRLERFNEALRREGAFYLFTLRLIPAVPFFAINLVMALTPLRARTFWWVSQLGMLPGTFVFVNSGAALPDLQTIVDHGASGIFTPRLVLSFVALGLFPLAAKKVIFWVRRRRHMPEEA